ncbi:MAG: hypothetical protein LBC74_09485 [Planctomycetaceae bacterium]|nr:hypothetical protein [Planctomycetaceae bacterium]
MPFAYTANHTLNVTVTIESITPIKVIEADGENPKQYVYCVIASANVNNPIPNAEMTPPNSTWTFMPVGKSVNIDGYSPKWGYIVTFNAIGNYSTTATASISFSTTENHADGSTTINS